MGYVISRVWKAVLMTVSDHYVDYKKEPEDRRFHFAYIDRDDYSAEHYARLMKKLRTAIKQNSRVNLVLERRPRKTNKKQEIDYLISAEFW